MKPLKRSLSFIIRPTLLVLSLTLTITAQAFAECDKKLIFGWSNWAPYHFENEGGLKVGVSFDVMDKITEAIGCEYEAQHYPWKRLLYLMAKDKIDVMTGIQANAERAEKAYFSQPYGYQYIALFVRKGESKKYPITTLEKLLQYQFALGVRDGVDYGPGFKQLLKRSGFKKQLHWVAMNTNPLKLAAGRIDGLLMDPLAAPHIFQEQGVYEKLERHPMPFIEAGKLSLMLNKKNVSTKTLNQINSAIDDLDLRQQYLSMLLEYEQVIEAP